MSEELHCFLTALPLQGSTSRFSYSQVSAKYLDPIIFPTVSYMNFVPNVLLNLCRKIGLQSFNLTNYTRALKLGGL